MAHWDKKQELLKEEHFEKDVLPNFEITSIEQNYINEEFDKYYSTYVKDKLLKALGITVSEYEKYLMEQRKEFNKRVEQLATLPN